MKTQTILAYHGGPAPIRRFSPEHGAQGLMWFSEDRAKIERGEAGAQSTRYIMTVRLKVKKVAGWKEYDELMLAQIFSKTYGFDAIRLDHGEDGADWALRDPKRVEVVAIEERPVGGWSSGKGRSSGRSSKPLVFFHGAHRWEGLGDLRPSKSAKTSKHGSGLYLTTHIDTARRYARGGGSVVRFEVSPDLRLLDDVKLDVGDQVSFVKGVPRMKHKREIEKDLLSYALRVRSEQIPAAIVGNLMSHYGVAHGQAGLELVRYYVSRGIDGDLVADSSNNDPSERWLVLFNMDKVLRHERVR